MTWITGVRFLEGFRFLFAQNGSGGKQTSKGPDDSFSGGKKADVRNQ
jgi:hypothetical protein